MTPVLTKDAIRQLPEPIVEKLRSLIGRIRRVLWWRGCWFSLAAFVACLLVVMAVDAAFDLESAVVRWALSLAALAVVAGTVWRMLIRPLSRTYGLAQVARLVEIHHPEMHERISTAVELLGSQDAAGLRGSDELLAEVVKSAVVDVGTVSPEKEYSSLPMRRPRRLAVGALAVLAAVLAIWPFQGGMLVARALLPFANIGSASAFDLRVITQDATVGEGEPLTILVAVKGRAAKRADLRLERAESIDAPSAAQPSIERLTPQASDQARPGETVLALALPSVQDSFRYVATAGRARSKTHFIEVLRRPDITGLRVVYTFPPYTGIPPRTDTESLGDIAALTGTQVEVTAVLSRPATEASLVYDQTENAGPPVELGTDNGQPVARWSAELTTGMNYRWTLHPKAAGDRFGKPASGTLRALDDLPPAVVIDSPVERELLLRPNDQLPIVYTAADDHGFSAVDLILKLDGKGARLLTAPLPDKDPQIAQTWHGTATIDLSKLPLVGVNELRITLRVADSLPPNLNGPQTTVAEDIVVKLNWGAESFAQQTVRLQEDRLRKELEQVKNDLWDQRRQAEEKSWQLREPDQMKSERLQELEQLTQRAASTAAQLEDLARQAANSAFAERAESIEQTAREQVQGAAESLQQIPQSDRPEQRSAAAEQARNQFESAARQLDDILNAFNQDREQGRELGELASLAREQQTLADQAAQGAPTDQAQASDPSDPSDPTLASTNPLTDPGATPEQRADAFDRWQEQQDSVEHRAQNMTNQFQQKVPADRQSDLATLAQQAEQLARRAEALAERQQEVATKAGAPTDATPPEPSTPPSPQATAQASQQQADVAALAEQLAESVESLRNEAGDTLRQNGEAEAQAAAAATALEAAADSGREASRALAQEATQPPATSRASASQETAQSQPATAQTGQSPDPNPEPSTGPSPASPGTPSADSSSEPGAAQPYAAEGAAPSTRPAENPIPTPGQQAAAETTTALEAASNALQQMAQALTTQSDGVATAAQALTAAAAQTKSASEAGDAARQAGQQAAQQAGETPGATQASAAAAGSAARLQALARSAATPAQQAATNLALAAATAQAAMGLPENALNQQNMGRHGSPKPGDGQQGQSGQSAENSQPSNQPGQEASDAAGLQSTQDYGLPPELAKLGLTPDDWTRLRGLVTSGADGAGGDQVPAESRDLVRGYFRALATGITPAAATPK
ncbi:MAG: hypothetical protein ACKV19_20085 [Verrucomicrobiales bacterium]